jgi:TrmH family RNA methyltransferase
MISKNQIKLITSLSQKKSRDESGLFVAEGTKLITDLLPAFVPHLFFSTTEWLQKNKELITLQPEIVSEAELHKISSLKTPQGVLAVFRKPTYTFSAGALTSRLSLALDNVQDPGNLGTIIRIADWFGIRDIFCSEYTVDAFGPKTVQATMGALARVNVHQVQLPCFLKELPVSLPVYGTFMDGKDIYTETLEPNGIIVMGNEGRGISPEVEQFVSSRLLIPNYPKGEPTSESLNVSVATALVCGEFRRRRY